VAPRPTKVSVPKSEVPSLKLLAHADRDILEAIERSLNKRQPSLDIAAVGRSLAGETGLDESTVVPIIGILWRLAFVRRERDLETEIFLDALAVGLQELGDALWTTADAEAWRERQDYIARLLSAEGPIGIAAKAGELLFEQQLVFCTARTLTDVRPVFDESAEHIQVFLPFHTLAITCHEAGEKQHIHFHIAMDFGDIVRLKKQLERAEKKEKLVREQLTKAGLAVIETGSEAGG